MFTDNYYLVDHMLQILKSDNISKTDWLYNFLLRVTKVLYFELNGSFMFFYYYR